MIQKTLLSGLAALALAGAMPVAAQQHTDLGVEEPATPPVQRRFLMEDTYGNVVTNEDVQGYFVLIYFGYTACPDVCPTTLAVVAEAVAELGPEVAEQVKVLFVTVDPDRDTSKLLREYVGYFDEKIIALRGPKAYTDHMVKTFNARYEFHVPDPAEPEVYSVDHTASVAMIGPDGSLIKRYPHGTTTDAMAKDLNKIISETVLE